MSKLHLIIGREYMAIVGRKSFIVVTLLIPFLVLLCGAIPAVIGYFNATGSDVETVIVVDHSGRYGNAIADNDNYKFVTLAGDSAAHAQQYYKNARGAVAAALVIPSDIDSTGRVTVYSDGTINTMLKEYIYDAMSDTLTRARIASHNIPGLQAIVDNARVSADVKSVTWSDDGSEKETSSEFAVILGMILALFTYMFVLMYGSMIMNGVIEEKTNRIVEVIVSSCRPFELMMGKILGVGLVGLTQFAIWTVLLVIIGVVAGTVTGVGALANGGLDMAVASANVPAQMPDNEIADVVKTILAVNYTPILVCFVLYFIGGYLLYASLFAAFGSAVDQASDASQFTTPIILIMVVALYAGIACAPAPNGPMAVWCSIIPFTSPVVMMVRLPYDVPMWQLVLSIVLLFVTALAMIWLAARIYRTGILMYGKKHSFKEVLRWIKR